MSSASLKVGLAITIVLLIIAIVVIIWLVVWGTRNAMLLTPLPTNRPSIPLVPVNPNPNPNPNPPVPPPNMDCNQELNNKTRDNKKILNIQPSLVKDIAEISCYFIVLTNTNKINLYSMDGELVNSTDNVDNLISIVSFNDTIFALDNNGNVYKFKSKLSSSDWYWEEVDVAPGEKVKWINSSLIYTNTSDFSSTSASGEKFTKSNQYLWITTEKNGYLINSKMNIIDMVETPEMRIYGAGKGYYLVQHSNNTITSYPSGKIHNNASYGVLNDDNRIITYDNKCGLIRGLRLIDNKVYYLINLLKGNDNMNMMANNMMANNMMANNMMANNGCGCNY